MKTLFNLTVIMALGFGLTACEGFGRPELEPMPEKVQMMQQQSQRDLLASIGQEKQPEPGSLWQPGSRHFFQDSRAREIGDILTVIISEQAEAESEANTETVHENEATSGVSYLAEVMGEQILPGITNDLETERENEFTGEGSTDRSDSLQGRVAAMITHRLPNGYFVIEGRREVLVNFEKQIMTISGIVRPEDITGDNTVTSDKIAEARISYAGEGVIDEVQNQPYGARFLQRWLPF